MAQKPKPEYEDGYFEQREAYLERLAADIDPNDCEFSHCNQCGYEAHECICYDYDE